MHRMKRSCRVGKLVAVALLLAAPAAAQTVSGTLVDQSTGQPIAGASVRLVDDDTVTRAVARTDAAGAWSLRAPRQHEIYSVRAQKVGFATVETDPFAVGDAPIVLRLSTRPEMLVLEEVTSQRLTYEAFLDRRERRQGLGLGPDQIAARIARVNATDLERLLWGLLPGMQTDEEEHGWLEIRRHPGARSGCNPTIFLDGAVVWRAQDTSLPPPDIDEVVPLWEIRALEVFHEPLFIPASLRLKHTAWDSCGLLAIWTYRGIGDP